ncbi:hypothetical protein OGATHE_006032 [Ogataea polymorpha]|uniref:Uncharacterized protein n=1 Tax=Ogataea polymorpha TaxID=460523 RepID=A0A9P8SYK0_9ASCO|nr:hypothetical protein OGATHE_006032 [Ogataea polymorpha]
MLMRLCREVARTLTFILIRWGASSLLWLVIMLEVDNDCVDLREDDPAPLMSLVETGPDVVEYVEGTDDGADDMDAIARDDDDVERVCLRGAITLEEKFLVL